MNEENKNVKNKDYFLIYKKIYDLHGQFHFSYFTRLHDLQLTKEMVRKENIKYILRIS